MFFVDNFEYSFYKYTIKVKKTKPQVISTQNTTSTCISNWRYHEKTRRLTTNCYRNKSAYLLWFFSSNLRRLWRLHWGIKEVIFLWYCLGGGGRGYSKMIWFRKLRFGNSLQWPIYIINSFDRTKFYFIRGKCILYRIDDDPIAWSLHQEAFSRISHR